MSKPTGPGNRALRQGRYSQSNGIYLVTAVTGRRVAWFWEPLLARRMSRCLSDPQYLLDSKNLCWAVMPDHIHLMLQLGRASLSDVVRQIKGRSAFVLNRDIARNGRFWAPGYHDHAMRKEESVREAARYIVANPVRAGLVKRVGDYPYWNAIWL